MCKDVHTLVTLASEYGSILMAKNLEGLEERGEGVICKAVDGVNLCD